MIKRFLIASLVLGAGTLASTTTVMAASNQADDITGVWRTKSGGYVQIYRDGDVYDGRIVGSVDGKARYDKNNPDPEKRKRRLLGVVILDHLKPEEDGAYDGGEIYDPNNGKSYSAKAKMTGPDTLDARGYIGLSLIGKTQTWHRIDPASANVHSDLLHQPVGQSPQ
ncbi:DUF2147 domain-containing protein [Salinisphaera sp. Q1T1-3]|uniref:DUF2147 domain-containing protein n=1 Tax=Salinisphaera sp. Q1T1-3 TaxID=2321229 RepID=UPI000E76CC9E|nr:DUF2147 domain-containing protein [Salinisphaera sp. Q1T1-3]RJS92482.1 DUF2147 domain-containing protein [Salinisphaera sp. Q1T1-3]